MEHQQSSRRRLGRLTRHVSASQPDDTTAHGCAAIPQVLAVAEPWIIAGLGTVLWAYTPQLMRLFRKLNPKDKLAGTTLTQEQLEAWSEGLHTIPVSHAQGSVSYTHKNPFSVSDVLHPKHCCLVGVPPAVLPLTMAKRLSFAKVLSERLGEDSEATARKVRLLPVAFRCGSASAIRHGGFFGNAASISQTVIKW